MTEESRSVRSSDLRGDDLSGAILPWANGAPIYVRASTPDQYYLPCFTDIDALRLFLVRVKVFEYEVKRVIVGDEFLKSFDGSNITVVLNPSLQPDGQLTIAEFHLPASNTWKLSQC